ncbi:MAG TPA: imidazole glycerol phosphate synthase subunit HisH [Deltaproteobacteria bacterium]|nr:imidazole glycerol phosphate synthase subunit HisH [Deltaproteobacteria bacterium]HPR56194.1 imidazole glycerol phosphate synthase subunit HisH [Deltaproteobacteria bacterium]HXK46431.1 imidazole glycerol phosphate synthase subunit HisH [Deltaproteobacteria bacterium]
MIAIIDYRAGNLRSVQRALTHLGLPCTITSQASDIAAAERVIFPGVGAAGKAMETIREIGLDRTIHEVIERGTPFLGICLGTQVIFTASEEDTATCLGVFPGTVRRFPVMGEKIPHMGWNTLRHVRSHPLLHGVDESAWFYFVHSYYPDPSEAADVVTLTSYGMEFASAVSRGNVFATQFHPEKSGAPGLRILENFSRWDGKG